VFAHADRRKPTGRGFVVRDMESGFPVDQYNYGGLVPVAVFSTRGRKAAERLAATLTRQLPGRAGNPGRWGSDLRSLGPIKTVAALKRLANRVLAAVRADSRMAAAAKFALSHPDAVLARPELQRELEDIARRYANPYSRKARYKHKRLRSPRRFARKSLRLTPERKGVRVVVGKLKGERRRVKRGPRKGRPVFTAQAVLRRKNRAASPPYSERQAWKAVQEMARRIARGLKGRPGLEELEADALIMGNLAEYMLDQVARGVHKNPLLAVFGNPVKGAVTGSDDIQAILYRHKEDGRDYVHPFGQGVKVQLKRDGSTVIRAAVNARSGVRAIGLPNGSVLLRHPTKPIWRDF